jgi:hypothetical protein
MNERIKELAEQCWDKRLDGVHFDIEMFAELIVRECAKVGDFDCPRCGHCCPQWVGLTDEEIKSLPSWWPSYEDAPALIELVKDVEAQLREKNK